MPALAQPSIYQCVRTGCSARIVTMKGLSLHYTRSPVCRAVLHRQTQLGPPARSKPQEPHSPEDDLASEDDVRPGFNDHLPSFAPDDFEFSFYSPPPPPDRQAYHCHPAHIALCPIPPTIEEISKELPTCNVFVENYRHVDETTSDQDFTPAGHKPSLADSPSQQWSTSESEWGLVHWLMTSGLSHGKIDDFLKLPMVRAHSNMFGR